MSEVSPVAKHVHVYSIHVYLKSKATTVWIGEKTKEIEIKR